MTHLSACSKMLVELRTSKTSTAEGGYDRNQQLPLPSSASWSFGKTIDLIDQYWTVNWEAFLRVKHLLFSSGRPRSILGCSHPQIFVTSHECYQFFIHCQDTAINLYYDSTDRIILTKHPLWIPLCLQVPQYIDVSSIPIHHLLLFVATGEIDIDIIFFHA